MIHANLRGPFRDSDRPELSPIEVIQQKVLGLKEEIDKACETRLQLIENQHQAQMALIEQQASQEHQKVMRSIEQQRTAQIEQLSLQAAQREREISQRSAA